MSTVSPTTRHAVIGSPIGPLIPCHRVVGSTGKLTGYAGGLKRKQHLLELEGAIPASLFSPSAVSPSR